MRDTVARVRRRESPSETSQIRVRAHGQVFRIAAWVRHSLCVPRNGQAGLRAEGEGGAA